MDKARLEMGSVPVRIAARVYGRDPAWVRAGIIAGWLPIGEATRNGKRVRGKDGRGETENKEETLKIKMELMGNRRLLIFFTQTRKMHGALWKENKWEAYGWMRKFKNSRR